MRKIILVFLFFTSLIGCNSDKSNHEQIATCGTVTDIDGNIYTSITIGEQCWTNSNLNVSRYRNGDPIPEITDPTQWRNARTGAWCYYDGNAANGAVYGKLYNWYAVNDPRGLAPAGYHIPTDAEWSTLVNFLGGEQYAPEKIKANLLWQDNSVESNSSGFAGIPGGYIYDSGFERIGFDGCWWTTTDYGSTAIYWSLTEYSWGMVLRPFGCYQHAGISVRCVMN